MAADVRVVVHDTEIAALLLSAALRDELLHDAEPVVDVARAGAPKQTGRGAASIHAEAILDGPEWTARIGWTRQRFYMRFHERGTRSLPPHPFLVPALEGLAR